jgi:hypothetical protein
MTRFADRRWLRGVTGAAALAALTGAVVAATTQACAPVDDSAVTEVDAPSLDEFVGVNLTATQAGVSRVLELRCGSLDCHGQVGRAMRIYGQDGLRFVDDAGDQPGVQPTTDTEHQANYQSVIGLQPEEMSLVVDQLAPPEALLLLRKPLQLERHKGGAVFVEGDDAYQCITSWRESSAGDAGSGGTDFTACGAAIATQ